MAFQIKDFRSIVASMINLMRGTTNKVSDYNKGSIVRTVVEAPGAEMDQLYQEMFIGLKEAIPVSVYNSFDFTRLPSVPASGLIRVSIAVQSSAVTIPTGTSFKTVGKSVTYTSAADVVIGAGSTFADVLVSASAAGVSGNLDALASFSLTPVPTGFTSATNQVAFSNGQDAETDDQRKLRFNVFIATLNRGTIEAVKYGMKTAVLYGASGVETERVRYTSVVEPYLADSSQPIAWLQCYVHNGVGNTSGALVSHTAEVIAGYTDANGNLIPGWKAAGVKVDVLAATEKIVNVAVGTLTLIGGYDEDAVKDAIDSAIFTYLASLNIGVSAIRSEIIAIAMGVAGVYNFTVTLPTGDTTAAANEKIMPGIVSYNVLRTPGVATLTVTGKAATRTP